MIIKIKRYEIRKGLFDSYILGIPSYKDAGISVYFTGTNAEVNEKVRELDQQETTPGVKWNITNAVDVAMEL